MSAGGPPRWAMRLLRWLLPAAEADFVAGDIDEEFRSRRERDGLVRALLWFFAEGSGAVLTLATYETGTWEGMMTGLRKDLRGAFRVFARAPGFAAVVVLTLAVGVGGATAVYSVIRGVVLSPLEFEDSDRVLMLWGQTAEYPRIPLTVGDHNALVDGVESLSAVTAAWGNNALMMGDAEPEQVSVGWVTPEYFDVVGVQPALGRALAQDDVNAIVISHGLWVRRWGADADILGKTAQLPGASFEIVGVLPADRNPNLTSFGGTRTDYDVWRLMPPDWTQGEDRSVGWLRSTARLRDGVTLAQAQAETNALMTSVNQTVTDRDGGTDLRINLVPVKEDLVGGVSRTLWILLGAVTGVLLIAASNVAHLLLGRGESRAAEVAVRAALGGSRTRLVRQFLVESGVLALAGGLLGVLVASFSIQALLALAPPTLPRIQEITLDWNVFGFALLATAAAAFVFGVVPALRATRTDLAAALGERSVTGNRSRQSLSRGLVVAEVALSLALLTATGLLLRSFAGLTRVDLGFETEGVVTFALEASDWGENREEAAARMADYEAQMVSVPGAQAAGFTNRIPLGGGLFTSGFRSEEMVAADQDRAEASYRFVTSGYFDAMSARLVAGRSFRSDDSDEVVLLDQTAAELMWPGESAVGRRLEIQVLGNDPHMAEVIGVVAPMKHAGVDEPAAATVFVSMLSRADQQNFRYMAVRVAGDPLTYVEQIKQAAKTVDGNAVIARVRTMDDLFAEDVAATRFATMLLMVFGGVALLLATVGLHGVMAYSVRRRTRELGIRVALGAEQGELLRKAVGSGAILVLVGVALGIVLSLGLGGVLQSLLYEVEPTDALSMAGAAAVMIAVGLFGSYLPARLVLAMDPAVTLREE